MLKTFNEHEFGVATNNGLIFLAIIIEDEDVVKFDEGEETYFHYQSI